MDGNEYGKAVGARLRRVRRNREMSLADVEAKSDGRWAAATLASYERADRSMKVEDLAALAEFYGINVRYLLPPEEERAASAA